MHILIAHYQALLVPELSEMTTFLKFLRPISPFSVEFFVEITVRKDRKRIKR